MTRQEWMAREAPRRRRAIRRHLGDLPAPAPLASRVHRREDRLGFTIEQVSFQSGRHLRVPALFLRPHVEGTVPAILYLHSHSHDYSWGKGEVLEGKGRMPGIGPALARAGYAVLAIDAWCFGDRRADENATAKQLLLQGRTLWGMMLADEFAALDYLETRREVDRARLGTFGFSMGATKSWWVAALDTRVRVAVAACGLTTYRALIAAEALNRHGIYYYVPGILRTAETYDIVSLIAPRPLLTLNGEEDPGSPLPGVLEVHRRAGAIYRLLGARANLSRILHPGGHEFTDAMRGETLAWLGRHLRPHPFVAP